MPEKSKGFVVMLASDTGAEDMEYIKNALKMIKGVESVSPVDHSELERKIKSEILESLWKWEQENLK